MNSLKDKIDLACEEWARTLNYFHCPRATLASEMSMLARSIHAHGIEAVIMAIIGAKHEKKNDTYDPADYLSLTRVLRSDKFDFFVNLGARSQRAETLAKLAAEEAEKKRQAEIDEYNVDLAKVRQLIGGLFGKMK